MADNTDNLSMGNFSIQDTMEMGMGNQELLNDLFSPETSTSDPDDVTPIIKDAEPATPPAKPAVPKGKEITPTEDDDDEKTKGQSAIANFLGDNSEDDDDDDDAAPAAPVAKTAPTDASNDEDEDPQGTQFTALANDLFKLGVFNKDEDDEEDSITTPEEFLERFEVEKKRGASEMVQNFIGQFGEDYQQAFEAIFVKGVNPKEYFGTYNEVVNFADMDLSEERNQMTIMKQALADQGFEHEDIESEIERLQNYGDLENVATKHHKVLVKKEAQKLNQMEAKAEKELQQKAAVRNQYIQNVQGILGDKLKSKEFDGIPLNPKLANELQDFLLVDKWKTTSGELLSDFDRTILDLKRPENHTMKVKVGLLLKILEKDPTLSTIQKSGVSKKTDQLFGEVARQVTKAKTVGGSKANPNSWFTNL
jgi:hypothetical protein